MIPSHPLDLGAIIGETVRIIKRSWAKVALLWIICLAPGYGILYLTTTSVSQSIEDWCSEYHLSTPQGERMIRDAVVVAVKENPGLSLYRLSYPEVFGSIDSAYERIAGSSSQSDQKAQARHYLDSITTDFKQTYSVPSGDTIASFFLGIVVQLILGVVVLILGSVLHTAATLDITCRVFEERQLPTGKIFIDALKRNAWLLIVQAFLFVLAMACGFGLVVGIGFGLSKVLGALSLFIALGLACYSLIRTMFCQVALVSEHLGPFESIKRSVILTKGHFFRIIGISFIFAILFAIVSTIVKLPFSAIFKPDYTAVQQYFQGTDLHIRTMVDWYFTLIGTLIITQLISTLLLSSVIPAYITTFYYDLRTRLEGPLDYHTPEPTVPPDSAPEIFLQ